MSNLNNKPKTINSLMKYLRDEKHISIGGSTQKKVLKNIGYYHGYKGYRFFNDSKNKFNINNFDELSSIYEFDMSLKSLFYPLLIELETIYKNFALDIILNYANSSSFNEIYNLVFTRYKKYKAGSEDYAKEYRKKLNLRNKIYSDISRDYGKKDLVSHFYNEDKPLPIWAIFEILSLGEFTNLIDCLNDNIRKEISLSCGFKSSYDNNGSLLVITLRNICGLRNSVAHNNPIYDTRFNKYTIPNRLINFIENEVNINNINFKTITDYVFLLVILMGQLNFDKNKIKKFVNDYEKICETLKTSINNTSIFNKIINSDNRNKIKKLKEYVISL